MGAADLNRYAGLDALRGFAAAVVVFHHISLTFPSFVGGDIVAPARAPWPGDPWAVVLQMTPLNLFFAGPQAVLLFFVLSGFVLTLPFDRPAGIHWPSYYPKRLLRLYLPIAASVILALATFALVPHLASADHTWWLNGHAHHVSFGGAIMDTVTVFGAGRYNSVLWSLRYEIIFSLLLPVYVILGRRLKRWWYLGAAVMILASGLGKQLGSDMLHYLPIFGIAVFLAYGREPITSWVGRSPQSRGCGMLVTGLLLLASTWAFPDFRLNLLTSLVASCLLVVAFMTWEPLIRVAARPGPHWLGSRSYSLYLVHEPIVVTMALLTGKPAIAALISLALIPVVTELFFRAVEDPGRRLAGAVGRRLKARSAAIAQTTPAS